MKREVKNEVIKVLQQSLLGFCDVRGRRSIKTGLSFWKRFLNYVMKKLGGQSPFIDPENFIKYDLIPFERVGNRKLIEDALSELSLHPRCNSCGSGKYLTSDPAGYYGHTTGIFGEPLVCTKCAN